MKIRLRPLREQAMVITGGSSGIGLATARMAAAQGARVVLASRDEEDLRGAVEEIRAEGGQASFHVCDVADPDGVKRLADTAEAAYGRIDTWVNNAGVSVYGRIEEVSRQDARRIFETNYWGVVNGSLEAVARMRASGGALINMGSIASERAIPLQGHYCASKHAVRGFTDALRMELEKDQVPMAVTLVMPGAIDTPYPQHARSYLRREPKHPPPVYAPETVARAVLHCAQHARREITVGGGGRMMTAMGNTLPRFTDRVMERTMFEQQMRHDSHPERRDALHAPVPGDAAVHGSQPGHVMRSSAYTQARLHPGLALLGAAGVLAAVTTAGRAVTRA